jgi:hypothetical protein
MTDTPNKEKEPELEPDAWRRFERAVDIVAKSPPQHKVKKEDNQKKKLNENEPGK